MRRPPTKRLRRLFSVCLFLRFENGRTLVCKNEDFSQHGLGLSVPPDSDIPTGSRVSVSLFRSDEEGVFPAVVTFSGPGRLGVQFDNLSLQQQAELASLTFSRADAWISTWGTAQRDKPLRSLGSVVLIGLRGIGQLATSAFKSSTPRPVSPVSKDSTP